MFLFIYPLTDASGTGLVSCVDGRKGRPCILRSCLGGWFLLSWQLHCRAAACSTAWRIVGFRSYTCATGWRMFPAALSEFTGRVIGCDDSFPWPPASHYLHRQQLITSYLLQSHSPVFPRTRTLRLNIDITLSTHYPGFDATKGKFKYTAA